MLSQCLMQPLTSSNRTFMSMHLFCRILRYWGRWCLIIVFHFLSWSLHGVVWERGWEGVHLVEGARGEEHGRIWSRLVFPTRLACISLHPRTGPAHHRHSLRWPLPRHRRFHLVWANMHIVLLLCLFAKVRRTSGTCPILTHLCENSLIYLWTILDLRVLRRVTLSMAHRIGLSHNSWCAVTQSRRHCGFADLTCNFVTIEKIDGLSSSFRGDPWFEMGSQCNWWLDRRILDYQIRCVQHGCLDVHNIVHVLGGGF